MLARLDGENRGGLTDFIMTLKKEARSRYSPSEQMRKVRLREKRREALEV